MLGAKTRHSVNSGECKMLTDAQVQAHADRIRDDGFTVIERAAAPNWSTD